MKRTKCCGALVVGRYEFELSRGLRNPAPPGAQITDYECCLMCGEPVTEDDVEDDNEIGV